jgi:metal-responsive CopG/Arc/MetJ family transcriptional regulator
MGSTKQKKSTPVMIRMPNELLERIDAHIKRMQEATPGVIVSRGDAIRSLMITTLDKAEKRAA